MSTTFDRVAHTRVAWLYCTHFGDLSLVGEITDEGSFKKLIDGHCDMYPGHEKAIHLIVQGSPQHTQLVDHAVEAAQQQCGVDDQERGPFVESRRRHATHGGMVYGGGEDLVKEWGCPTALHLG